MSAGFEMPCFRGLSLLKTSSDPPAFSPDRSAGLGVYVVVVACRAQKYGLEPLALPKHSPVVKGDEVHEWEMPTIPSLRRPVTLRWGEGDAPAFHRAHEGAARENTGSPSIQPRPSDTHKDQKGGTRTDRPLRWGRKLMPTLRPRVCERFVRAR
jgi:hypothetical protein